MKKSDCVESEKPKIELTVKKVLEGHEESVFSCLCFEYPHYVIVTCSADHTIRIWDSRDGDCLKIITRHTMFVNDVVKWDDESFISCGEDSKMFSFSVKRPFKMIKKFELNQSGVQTALKISQESFITINNKSEILVISFTRNEIVRKLETQEIHFYPVLLESEIANNCFYLNTHGDEHIVKLIDYENDIVVAEMKDHELSPIYSLMNYRNKSDEEILCCGNCASTVYFYNLGKSENLEKKKEKYECFMKVRLYRPDIFQRLMTMTQINSQYLLIGDSRNTITVMDLENPRTYSSLVISSDIAEVVMEIQYVVDFRKNSNVRLVCSTSNSKVILLNSNMTINSTPQFGNHFGTFSHSFFRGFNRKVKEIVNLEEEKSMYKAESYSRKDLEALFDNLTQTSYDDFCSQEFVTKSPEFEVDLLPNPFWKNPTSANVTENQTYYIGEVSPTNPLIAEGRGILFHKTKNVKIFRKGDVFFPRYIGGFKNGNFDGKARLYGTTAKKNMRHLVFEGEFRNGEKEGRGMEYDSYTAFSGGKSSNNSTPVPVFEGLYKNNVREGLGYQYNKENGDCLKGTWRNGVMDEKLKVFRFRCPIIPYTEISAIKNELSEGSILGSGGFGSVYKIKSSLIPSLKTYNLVDEEPFVAIKIMKTGGDRHYATELYRRMKRGIELCRSLEDQSRVLETYGIFRGIRDVGCIMKCCECDVSSLIVNGKCSSLEEKIRILHETARGVSEFHRLYIMHRDLKWSNVLKDFNGDIKLTDFDCTKEDLGKIVLNLDSQTRTIGSPFFLAPEVFYEKTYRKIHGEDFRYGIECDLYSFGIMMYSILLEATNAFQSQIRCSCGSELDLKALSLNSLYKHIYKCKLRPLLDGSKLSKFPSYLIDLMIQCWDNNPFKRPRMEDIVQVFDYERKKSNSRKNYNIFKFVFPKYKGILESDTMLLLCTSTNLRTKIIKFLESKFSSSKKETEGEGGGGGGNSRETKTVSVEALVHKVYGTISSDEDIHRIIERENNPVVEVELKNFETIKTGKHERLEKEVEELKKQLQSVKEFVGDLFSGLKDDIDGGAGNTEALSSPVNERLTRIILEKEKVFVSLFSSSDFVSSPEEMEESSKDGNNEETEGEGEL